ncbi:hypothetical protein D3C71_1893240 [compost metagenome]
MARPMPDDAPVTMATLFLSMKNSLFRMPATNATSPIVHSARHVCLHLDLRHRVRALPGTGGATGSRYHHGLSACVLHTCCVNH